MTNYCVVIEDSYDSNYLINNALYNATRTVGNIFTLTAASTSIGSVTPLATKPKFQEYKSLKFSETSKFIRNTEKSLVDQYYNFNEYPIYNTLYKATFGFSISYLTSYALVNKHNWQNGVNSMMHDAAPAIEIAISSILV